MRLDPAVLDSTADLLSAAGPLAPLHLTLSAGAIQVLFRAGEPTTEQLTSLIRLAATLGVEPLAGALGRDSLSYTLTSVLTCGSVLVAGTHPPTGPAPGRDRATSTGQAVQVLRSLLPWASADVPLPCTVAEVHVIDDGGQLAVHVVAQDADDPLSALIAVSAGIAPTRPVGSSGFSAAGRGRLPSGQALLISVN